MAREGLRNHSRTGMVLVLALLFLSIFAALAAAFAASTDLTLQTSRNHRLVLNARLAAESGLNFHRRNLRRFNGPGNPGFASNSLGEQAERFSQSTGTIRGI